MTERKYTAENGTEITDELIDQWGRRSRTRIPGRPDHTVRRSRMGSGCRTAQPRTIRLSDTMWHLIEADAKRQHMSVSAWTRAAMTERLSRRSEV